jgi:hypothetical protein
LIAVDFEALPKKPSYLAGVMGVAQIPSGVTVDILDVMHGVVRKEEPWGSFAKATLVPLGK